jgi:hypothetical protein
MSELCFLADLRIDRERIQVEGILSEKKEIVDRCGAKEKFRLVRSGNRGLEGTTRVAKEGVS